MDLLMNACCEGYNHRGLSKVSPFFFFFLLLSFCWCMDRIWKIVCNSVKNDVIYEGLIIKMTETTQSLVNSKCKSSIMFNRLINAKNDNCLLQKIILFFFLFFVNVNQMSPLQMEYITKLAQNLNQSHGYHCIATKLFSWEQANVHQKYRQQMKCKSLRRLWFIVQSAFL